jgi:hypothetical protein
VLPRGDTQSQKAEGRNQNNDGFVSGLLDRSASASLRGGKFPPSSRLTGSLRVGPAAAAHGREDEPGDEQRDQQRQKSRMTSAITMALSMAFLLEDVERR